MTTMSSPVAPARNRRQVVAMERPSGAMSKSGSGRAVPLGPVRSSASTRGASSSRRLGDEVAAVARPEVVIPVPDRVASRTAAPTRRRPCGPSGARGRRRNRRRRDAAARTAAIAPGIASDRDPGDPTRRRQQEPRLAARRGEVPQRRRRLLVRLVVRLVGRLGVRVGAGGGEQQRPIGQELGVALADGGPGQPARRRLPGRIHLPQRGAEVLAVGAEGRHRHDQARSVGRQPQPGESRKGDEMVEIEGFGHGPKFGRPRGATVPQPEVGRVATVQSALTHDRCPRAAPGAAAAAPGGPR